MSSYNDNSVIMENVRIVFRNFAGKEGMYNREGDRNFAVLLDDETANAMGQDGWNVRWLKAREEGDSEQAYLQVSLKYRARDGKPVKPPRIVMITSRGRTPLLEDEVELLDWADIESVDLIVRPYDWSVNGKGGVKAYLKSMFVTIREDALEMKYSDINDVPARAGRSDH